MGVRSHSFLVCIVATLVCATVSGAERSALPRTGSFQTTFTQRSPLGSAEAQNRRHRLRITDQQRYEQVDHTFEITVPDSYDGELPFGILVWISPGRGGGMPKQWEQTLGMRSLIWVGANDAGNDRGVGVRFGLALDAVHNLKQEYLIDDSRVYVAGFSGGGKCATMLGVIYPDVFDGALAMGGVAFYRNIDIPDRKNMAWARLFDKPPAKMFELAKSRTRFVLMIGDEDSNHQSVKATYETGFVEDQFAHVTYLEIAGLAHELPDGLGLEKAIGALDEPLRMAAKDVLAEAVELEKQGRFADAYRLYLRVSMHGGETLGQRADAHMGELFERARRELVEARRAAERGQFVESAEILLKLRETYGPAAPPEADELMGELEANPQASAQINAHREQEIQQRREADAAAALESARLLLERDVRRAYEALRQVESEFAETSAAQEARTQAERLLADAKTRELIDTHPDEVEAEKLLNLAENYYRNRLNAQARQRLEMLLERYPDTKSAARARELLDEITRKEHRR